MFNGSTKFIEDAFENIFDTWSKVQSFPFYNVVKYSKGKYGLEIGLAGYNKENVLVEVKDGILTVEGNDCTFDHVSKIFSNASSKNFVDPLNICLLKLLKTSRFVIIISFVKQVN